MWVFKEAMTRKIIDYRVECLMCGRAGPWYSEIEDKWSHWDKALCERCYGIYLKACPDCGQPDCWVVPPEPGPQKGCGIPCYDRKDPSLFPKRDNEPPSKICKRCGHSNYFTSYKSPGGTYPFELPMDKYVELINKIKEHLG